MKTTLVPLLSLLWLPLAPHALAQNRIVIRDGDEKTRSVAIDDLFDPAKLWAYTDATLEKDWKDKGFKWLRENGLGDLISETVNAGTLASAMRNMILDQGIEPPDDVIKVTTYKATSINKYTPK